MLVIFWKNLSQQFVFGVVDSLDNVFIVPGEVEEASALSWRAQLGEDILAGQGHQIVGRVKAELGSQMPENPRRIVLKFEVVFCRGRQLVTSTNSNENVSQSTRLGTGNAR